MTKSTISCFLLLVLAVVSCTYDKAPQPAPAASITGTVSFANDIHPIIVTNCLGQGTQTCHVTPSNQGSNGDFTTYTGFHAKVLNGSLQLRALNAGGGMPPAFTSGPTVLSASDKQKIESWMSNGAPNN
jgi:hypothetical protein